MNTIDQLNQQFGRAKRFLPDDVESIPLRAKLEAIRQTLPELAHLIDPAYQAVLIVYDPQEPNIGIVFNLIPSGGMQ